MNRKVLATGGALAVVGAMTLSAILPVSARQLAAGNGPTGGSHISATTFSGNAALSPVGNHLFKIQSEASGRTLPLRQFAKPIVQDPNASGVETVDSHDNPATLKGHNGPQSVDSVAQRSWHTNFLGWTGTTPSTTVTIEGISRVTSGCVCRPPDTNGAASANFYVQDTNIAFQVWSKTGTSLLGPVNINLLFAPLGNTAACAVNNDGDPVVNYDRLADRWIISQFTSSHPYDECIAVSQTNDPTGAYNVYQFHLPGFDATGPNLVLNFDQSFQDYPKISIWPNGYYMTTNQFPDDGSIFANYGANTYVFDRTAMISGASTVSALVVPFPGQGGLLAADLDGTTLPPVGSPESIVENWNNNDGFGNGSLLLYHLNVDFSNLDNSTLDGGTFINVAPWNWLCTDFTTFFDRNCFAQPGQTKSSQSLDALGDRILFRAAYRNFGDHQGILINQGVDLNTGGRGHTPNAGVRWYEIRDVGNNPYLYQQGTIAPDNGNRWLGSLAFDKNGDIAAGYSVVNADPNNPVHPSIRYATRLATDPLGTFDTEKTLQAGTGYQTSASSRWGDYSDMVIDPTNDCSFWFTSEYYNSIGGAPPQNTGNWQTKIGKFTIPECTSTRLQPTAQYLGYSHTIRATAGLSFSNALLGTYRDTQAPCAASGDGYHALIDWGDRSTPSYATVTKLVASCVFNINAPSHTYASPGTYKIVTVIQNPNGATAIIKDIVLVGGSAAP